jgi:hypothetical protein
MMQDSRMQDLIDWDTIMPLERYAGGHDEQMKNLFKGATVIAHYNEKDYQGVVATLVKLEDGRFACYSDYYGSCCGCDAWEGATDEQVRTLCINLANGAKLFENVENLKEWLTITIEEQPAEWYEFREPAPKLLEELSNYALSA